MRIKTKKEHDKNEINNKKEYLERGFKWSNGSENK